MLLRGKLLDYYVDLGAADRESIDKLKGALTQRAGLKKDALTAARTFVQRIQQPQEKVVDFVSALKKLFKEAYPEENLTSTVLLQRFMTGLRPTIARQLLLKGKPENLEEAVKAALDVEYALAFADGVEGTYGCAYKPCEVKREVNTVQTQRDDKVDQLQRALEDMTKKLESLEAELRREQRPQQYAQWQRGRPGRRPRYPRPGQRCFMCGEEGHLRRQCPLNYNEPARTVGDSWQSKH